MREGAPDAWGALAACMERRRRAGTIPPYRTAPPMEETLPGTQDAPQHHADATVGGVEPVTLDALPKGVAARIVEVRTRSAHERSKLMALGLTPHTVITVNQRFPSIVVEIGFTQIALDMASASAVLVQPD